MTSALALQSQHRNASCVVHFTVITEECKGGNVPGRYRSAHALGNQLLLKIDRALAGPNAADGSANQNQAEAVPERNQAMTQPGHFATARTDVVCAACILAIYAIRCSSSVCCH